MDWGWRCQGGVAWRSVALRGGEGEVVIKGEEMGVGWG